MNANILTFLFASFFLNGLSGLEYNNTQKNQSNENDATFSLKFMDTNLQVSNDGKINETDTQKPRVKNEQNLSIDPKKPYVIKPSSNISITLGDNTFYFHINLNQGCSEDLNCKPGIKLKKFVLIYLDNILDWYLYERKCAEVEFISEKKCTSQLNIYRIILLIAFLMICCCCSFCYSRRDYHNYRQSSEA